MPAQHEMKLGTCPPSLAGGDQPESFDACLAGCSWGSDDAGHHTVLDEAGKRLGVGSTRRTAALLAKHVRQSDLLQPGRYHPCLDGCRFGVKAHLGDPVSWTTVVDARGAQIALAPTKQEAATVAARSVLKRRALQSLSLDEFRVIATVLTVVEARGKTGKARTGEPYLKLDYSTDPKAGETLRALMLRVLADGAQESDEERGAQAWSFSGRLRAAAEAAERLLHQQAPATPIRAQRLPNSEWLVLRSSDAPAPRHCLELVHDQLGQRSVPDLLDIDLPGEGDPTDEAMRPNERER